MHHSQIGKTLAILTRNDDQRRKSPKLTIITLTPVALPLLLEDKVTRLGELFSLGSS
jgi:hypothetical protein